MGASVVAETARLPQCGWALASSPGTDGEVVLGSRRRRGAEEMSREGIGVLSASNALHGIDASGIPYEGSGGRHLYHRCIIKLPRLV